MATEAEIVDAKIKLKEANDVVSSIIDRYVRNSMAGIAGEKNEYVLSDMLLRGKIDVSEIGDEFGSVRIDKSVSAEEMDSSHSAESDIVDEMDVAQRNENTVGDERDEVQENSGQTESGVRFNEFGEIVRDENTAVNTRDVSGAEAGQDIPTFTPPVMDDEIPTFTPPESQAESGRAASADTKLESALTSVFGKDKAKASQNDLNAGGVVNGAQDDDFMAQIRAMQNQMNAEKEGAEAVDAVDNAQGEVMGQTDLGTSVQPESAVRFNEFGEIVRDENTTESVRDVSGAEAGRDIPTFTPPVMDDEIPTFTPPENQAEKKNEIVDENVNKLGADNGNSEKVEDIKAAEADNNKEFKPIDFSFENENEVAAEAENQKQAELSAEAASGRVDNLSDDALERLKASLKVAGEEERER